MNKLRPAVINQRIVRFLKNRNIIWRRSFWASSFWIFYFNLNYTKTSDVIVFSFLENIFFLSYTFKNLNLMFNFFNYYVFFFGLVFFNVLIWNSFSSCRLRFLVLLFFLLLSQKTIGMNHYQCIIYICHFLFQLHYAKFHLSFSIILYKTFPVIFLQTFYPLQRHTYRHSCDDPEDHAWIYTFFI